MIPIHTRDGSITFAVRVQPRAKKNAITGQVGDALKLSLTAPPVEGAANEACVAFFAKLLRVPRSSISLVSGEAGRNKVLRIAGVNAETLSKALPFA